MEGMAERTDEKVTEPLGKEERNNIIAWATTILKEETDDDILRLVSDLLRDLRTNVGIREGLQSFRKNGWGFIRKIQEPKDDLKLKDSPTSSSVMVELKQAKLKPKLETRLDHETHPLNNELILKNIFEFTSVNDLKNCRLVSKKWFDLSLSAWRRKAVLLTEILFEEESESVNFNVDKAAEKFKENASELQKAPLQRYDMILMTRGFSNSPETNEKRKLMLNAFSSSIQILHFHCGDLELISLLLTKLPELRVLYLRLEWEHLFREYKSIPKGGEDPFQSLQSVTSKLHKLELELRVESTIYQRRVNFPWRKIIETFPSLRSLILESYCRGRPLLHEQIMQTICQVRRKGKFSSFELEELTIYQLSDEVVRRISESRFPLRSLSIHVGDNNTASTISDLFEACGETLEFLKCGFQSYEECRRLRIEPYLTAKVSLPNLKKLVLGTGLGLAFPNLLCSLDLPNLEDLIIGSNRCYQKECKENRDFGKLALKSKGFRDSCVYPNLKKFIYNEMRSFSANELRILARAMPNVTDLCIPLGSKIFPIVYELWPGLESLHLVATSTTCSLLDDYAITGFPVPVVNYCGDTHAKSRGSNITNLRNVRKFVLETRLEYNTNLLRPRKAWITDLSAVHGFLQLPKLEILEIESVVEFSSNVMAALKHHVSEISIREPKMFTFVPPGYSSEDDSETSSEES